MKYFQLYQYTKALDDGEPWGEDRFDSHHPVGDYATERKAKDAKAARISHLLSIGYSAEVRQMTLEVKERKDRRSSPCPDCAAKDEVLKGKDWDYTVTTLRMSEILEEHLPLAEGTDLNEVTDRIWELCAVSFCSGQVSETEHQAALGKKDDELAELREENERLRKIELWVGLRIDQIRAVVGNTGSLKQLKALLAEEEGT